MVFKAHVETLFLTVLHAQQYLKGCVARALPSKFDIFARANSFLPPNGKKMSMFNLHGRASKFSEDKGWFLYQKTILIVNMRRRLQGKK